MGIDCEHLHRNTMCQPARGRMLSEAIELRVIDRKRERKRAETPAPANPRSLKVRNAVESLRRRRDLTNPWLATPASRTKLSDCGQTDLRPVSAGHSDAVLVAAFMRLRARGAADRSSARNDNFVGAARSCSALEARGIDAELARLVADDAFGRAEHARGGGDVAALVAQRLFDHLPFEPLDRLRRA